ncbi:N-acetyltransferase ESCO1 isoform X2 [Elgaria multicarinata webbii]
MAAQKRKSMLVEPPAKRRKLDKNNKSVTTSKERKLLDAKHVSNKKTVLKKEMHKVCTKTNRSAVNKSIHRSSRPSSQTKRAQKHPKQTLNELKKKTCKTVCGKRTSLKSLGKLSSTKTSLKTSKTKHAKYLNSTKTRICSRGKGKPSAVKSKTSHESKKQKKSSAETKKCPTEAACNRYSALRIKSTHKNLCSETKLKNSKKDTTKTSKYLKSSNVNLEVLNSKNLCAKKSAPQNPEPTRAKTFGDKKTFDSDQEKISTRSMGTNSNKSAVRIRQEQLHFTKTKAVSRKEMVQEFSKSRHTVSHDERQTRKSPRLLQSPIVPTKSLRSRKIKEGPVPTTKQCIQMKKQVPCIKKEKVEYFQQKMEEKPLKNDDCKNLGREITSFEKIDSLKDNKHEDFKSNDLTASQDTLRESRNNLDCVLQESRIEPANTISCSMTSTCSIISKEKKTVPRNGKLSVKAKRVLPAPLNLKPAYQPEEVMKSKKISILELCEEIAGEIESDTVEVKRDSPNAEYGKEEERDTVVELPQPVISTDEETKQNSQCKRFFPSKKGMPVKCTVNGRHSIANKNSKWTKIKLTKVNHVNQTLSNSSNTSKHSFLKSTVPEGQQAGAVEIHLPESQRKLIQSQNNGNTTYDQKSNTACFEGIQTKDRMSHVEEPTIQAIENGLFETKHCSEPTADESFNLHLDSSPENTPMKIITAQPPVKQVKKDTAEIKSQGPAPKQLVRTLFANKIPEMNESRAGSPKISLASKCGGFLSPEEHIQKLREAAKDSDKQLIIDAGQKRFGAISCNVCGMLYTASNPEDETQHLLFHNQFISAVKYVGWKKERILAEYPDGKMIMVLPDDPKYALRKVDEIREMVDNDLGFQQAPLTCSRTKTLLFISNDKKVTGCLIAEHIQWGYRVIEEKIPEVSSENEKVTFERQKAWCCSTSPEPAICGISRIWVFSMMRRKKIASRMLECLRSNFIYGSYLSKEEIAFSDPTPDGKLFATQYFGTSQFLVYNFLSGQQPA